MKVSRRPVSGTVKEVGPNYWDRARRPSDSTTFATIDYLLRESMSSRLYSTLNLMGTWPGPEMVWRVISGAMMNGLWWLACLLRRQQSRGRDGTVFVIIED